jgi:hypothetical protein
MNMTIAKNFRMRERTLQVRADVFSALNRKIWGNPITAINNSQFGRLTSAGGNRSMQLGARFTF